MVLDEQNVKHFQNATAFLRSQAILFLAWIMYISKFIKLDYEYTSWKHNPKAWIFTSYYLNVSSSKTHPEHICISGTGPISCLLLGVSSACAHKAG